MITLTTRPNESAAIVLRVTFRDMDNELFTPTSCVWSLTNPDKAVVNGRDRVAVSISGNYHDFVISGDDIVYADGEYRTFLVEGLYDSAFGNDIPFREEAKFFIQDTVRNAI